MLEKGSRRTAAYIVHPPKVQLFAGRCGRLSKRILQPRQARLYRVRDAFVDAAFKALWHTCEGLFGGVRRPVPNFVEHRLNLGLAESRFARGLDEVTAPDVEDLVFAAGADRHRKLVAVVRNLFLVECRLRREHVIEWGEGNAAPRAEVDAEIFAVPVGRADQPEYDLAFEEIGAVLRWLVARGQQLQYIDRARPVLVADDGGLIFAGRRDAERLAAILLGNAEQLLVAAPLAVETFYNEYAALAESLDMRLRDIEPELVEQGQAIVLVVDARGHVDDARRGWYLADLGLEDMRRRGDADRRHPSFREIEQRCLFLNACDRNPKLVIGIDAERHAAEIGEHLLDRPVADRFAMDGAIFAALLTLRQELHRADAVAADLIQQAVGVGSRGAGVFGDTPPDIGIVGKEVVEDRGDRGAAVGGAAQGKRERNRKAMPPFEPAIVVTKADCAARLFVQLTREAPVYQDVERDVRLLARHLRRCRRCREPPWSGH